ncbi:MAG: peptide ABC transporter substrate-binding protein [Mycobacteriaceae bacterium]|nr:peptide ABC transporter substrate-binding protein [Mycobacteriaceae bacterium]
MAVAVVVAGCGVGRTDDTDYRGAIVVGTTDKIYSIDPAKSYDNGSWQTEIQVYPFLMNYRPGSVVPEPDAAESCGFAEPTRYVCTLKAGLAFANGHPLTARSVKGSFDRVLKIDDPDGPAALLGNLHHTDAVDDRTVAFTLKVPDQTFPALLATPATPIVDESVFPADRVLGDDAIVAARPFAGPFTIAGYAKNRLVEFRANPAYRGILGRAKAGIVASKFYTSGENMKMDLQNGALDAAYRTLGPQDVDTLRRSKKVKVYTGPGGELRFLTFNLKTMPGGDDAGKLAVRKAVAVSVDREALARDVYRDTYRPAYSTVPQGLPGAASSFKDVYGAKPNRQAAAGFLAAAGVRTPVRIQLQYNSDHYGASSAEEYAAIKSQLEATGLFRVNLQSTEWVTYNEERTKDSYPVFQLGWFPDYPDADNYLTPILGPNNMTKNHFSSPDVNELLAREIGEPDPAARRALLGRIQRLAAEAYLPVLPLVSGEQIAVAANDIRGVQDTLDASFRFRLSTLSRS